MSASPLSVVVVPDNEVSKAHCYTDASLLGFTLNPRGRLRTSGPLAVRTHPPLSFLDREIRQLCGKGSR
jgi:hypothetical protein